MIISIVYHCKIIFIIVPSQVQIVSQNGNYPQRHGLYFNKKVKCLVRNNIITSQ